MQSNKSLKKINVSVKSSVHTAISHLIEIDLHCYETLPQNNLFCREKMPSERQLSGKEKNNGTNKNKKIKKHSEVVGRQNY